MLRRLFEKRKEGTVKNPVGDAELPAVLTVAEVAAYLRLDPRTVETNLLRPGVLHAKKVGSRWRITREAVVEYLKSKDGGSA